MKHSYAGCVFLFFLNVLTLEALLIPWGMPLMLYYANPEGWVQFTWWERIFGYIVVPGFLSLQYFGLRMCEKDFERNTAKLRLAQNGQ